MLTSEKIDQIAVALHKAQSLMPSVHKDANNPYFNSKYASLAAISASAMPGLSANGIAVIQGGGQSDDAGMEIITRLQHTSGQWIESTLRLPIIGQKIKGGGYEPLSPQAAGSAFTYGRRYGLAAILGIVADDDDDGEAATAPTCQPAAKPAPRPAPKAPAKKGGVPKECPKCGGKVWDNREKKESGEFKETGPDWSCADKECKDGKYRTGGWVSEEVVGGDGPGHPGNAAPPDEDWGPDDFPFDDDVERQR